MKKSASVVSALVLALGFVGFVGLPSSAAACVSSGSFAGGDGSFGDPYQIATASQLQYFANHQNSTSGTANAGMVNDRIVLTADIDMAGCAFTPQFVSVPFKGTLEGQNHTISNLSVSKPSSSSAGLFSTTGAGAIIKDLTLQSPTVSALSYVGALVGEGSGTDLVNITVLDATITGSGSSVGGIAGKLSSQSGRTTDSLIVRDSAISGGSSAGGLFGLLTQGTVNEVSVSGTNVSLTSSNSPNEVGGLVGWFGSAAFGSRVSSTITKASFVGTISVATGSTVSAGLLMGNVRNSAVTITDSYARGEIRTGSSTTAAGVAGQLQSTDFGSTLSLSRVYVQGAYTQYSDNSVAVSARAIASSTASTSDSFYDSTVHTNWSSTTGATAKTSTELAHIATFTAPWSITDDFAAVRGGTATETWIINSQLNGGLPFLAWEYDAGSWSIPCQYGTYSVDGYLPCVEASPGRYVPTQGATAELICAAGTYQPNSGERNCINAQPGYFVASQGSTAQTACEAGTTSQAQATTCYAISFTYHGPLLDPISESAAPGEVVMLTGKRLSTITSVELDGIGAVADCTDSSCSFTVPDDVAAGTKDLVLIGSHGKLTVQGAITVSDPSATPLGTVVTWTKNQGDGTVKMYAKNIVGAGKVQFLLNGKEIAWVNAVDEADPKLRSTTDFSYMVRTIFLEEGKNVLEIYLDGVRTSRTAYTE